MSNLPGWVTRNFRLKVGCALLAVITWGGVVYAGNPPVIQTRTVPVPQQASGIPPGFVLVHRIQDLQLRVGGTRDALNSFDSSDLDIHLNWRGVRHGGVQQIPISITNNDPSVELLNAPSSVQANVDTINSVTLPVTIAITGNPPPGILLGAQSASPSSVTAIGPSHELTGLSVRVNVDLSSSRANYQAELALYPYSASGQRLADIELSRPSVTVSIALSSNITSRVVAVRPVISGRVSAGYLLVGVSYAPQTVTLTGPQDLLNTIDSLTTPTISINGLTGNEVFSEPLQVPDGLSASTTTIAVTILVEPVAPATPTPTPAPTPT